MSANGGIERGPSFFKVGGREVLRQNIMTSGKADDGSFFIDIAGVNNQHVRAYMTPQQTYDLCKGLLKALGYVVEKPK